MNKAFHRAKDAFPAPLDPQAGGGLLAVIAALGLVLALSQGAMYYRAKTSAKFLGSEKNKVLAQQMAEAGIEVNIADIGTRRMRITHGLIDSTTYSGKPLGGGF